MLRLGYAQIVHTHTHCSIASSAQKTHAQAEREGLTQSSKKTSGLGLLNTRKSYEARIGLTNYSEDGYSYRNRTRKTHLSAFEA